MTGILGGTADVAGLRDGLLKVELFDPVPISLNDGRILSKENLPGDIVDGAVKILTCLDALVRETGFNVDDQVLLDRVERAVFEVRHSDVTDSMFAEAFSRGLSVRVSGFDHAAADCACKLAYCLLKPNGRFTNPSRIRADDRTCSNILLMTERMSYFLDAMGPARRICFHFGGGYGRAVDSGYGMFLTDGCLWDITTSADPLPEDARIRLLLRYALSVGCTDPALRSVSNIGIVNPRLHCAYMTSVRRIPEETLRYVAEGVAGIEGFKTPSIVSSEQSE